MDLPEQIFQKNAWYQELVYEHPVESAARQIVTLLEERLEAVPAWCPLFRGDCRDNCINYEEHQIKVGKVMVTKGWDNHNKQNRRWMWRVWITYPHCSCPMINPYREIDQ